MESDRSPEPLSKLKTAILWVTYGLYRNLLGEPIPAKNSQFLVRR